MEVKIGGTYPVLVNTQYGSIHIDMKILDKISNSIILPGFQNEDKYLAISQDKLVILYEHNKKLHTISYPIDLFTWIRGAAVIKE